MSENTVNKLITNGRGGDEEAIGRLLDQFRNYLLAIANRNIDTLTRQKFAASDIVQESLLTAHQQFEQFRGDNEEELLAWLRTILHNDLIEARRKYRQTKKRSAERERSIMFKTSLDLGICDRNQTPRTDAVAGEEARLLEQAIGQLNVEYQEIIQLRSWDELSFEEIGQRMNRSADAARKLWKRAILQLQTILDAG